MLVSRGVLKHNVGEESQELLHLEVGWPLMRLWELRLDRGLDFGDGRELGRYERGVSGSNFARHLHQLCKMHIRDQNQLNASYILLNL